MRDLIAAGPANRFAIAVDAPDAVLTYGDLRSQVDQLAGVLQQLGVGPGDRVALCAPRSAALVVGALGIVAAGACYVALDPAHPQVRLAQLAERAGAAVAVVSSAQLVELGDEVTRVELDAATGGCACASAPLPVDPRPAVEPGPQDPAYVVFTSGSTGMPKGVVVSHGGLSNLISWHRRAFALTKDDRTTLIASPAFDASIWELWPTLAVGGSLHIPPDELRTDPAGLRDWLVERAITVTFVPTAVTEQLLTLSWPRQVPLRVLLTGGDALHRRPRAGLSFSVVNNYGVSEASVVSTSGAVSPAGDAKAGAAPSIGAAIDGVTLVVVDDTLTLVAQGEPGELLIGGVSVALSYLNEPELTARAFLRRSFAGGPEQQWYRTGDLVRCSPDGTYEHLGRIDDQVQVRGSRVELGEVAAALDKHPLIRASVVVARGEGMLQRLVAYAVSVDCGELNAQELADFAAAQLPEHMVPGAVVILPELPITANGKIDRAALPEPAATDRVVRGWSWKAPDDDPASGGDPAAEVEVADADPALLSVVSALVCELLELPSVDHQDNFFLLGGHSMLGAQLIAHLD
ncbi:MAG: non-ribosomal peptide synthase/amino acid adenylation enzyme, partial [Mycobacterium sp.]|nr:non-ribosomal peptide synthase/amino acid adenylation enzyme [Mycobacterium sp.]